MYMYVYVIRRRIIIDVLSISPLRVLSVQGWRPRSTESSASAYERRIDGLLPRWVFVGGGTLFTVRWHLMLHPFSSPPLPSPLARLCTRTHPQVEVGQRQRSELEEKVETLMAKVFLSRGNCTYMYVVFILLSLSLSPSLFQIQELQNVGPTSERR